MARIDALFEQVTKAIAHPHSTITEHDKERAAQIFTLFHNYLEEGEIGSEGRPDYMFGDFGKNVLEELR